MLNYNILIFLLFFHLYVCIYTQKFSLAFINLFVVVITTTSSGGYNRVRYLSYLYSLCTTLPTGLSQMQAILSRYSIYYGKKPHTIIYHFNPFKCIVIHTFRCTFKCIWYIHSHNYAMDRQNFILQNKTLDH